MWEGNYTHTYMNKFAVDTVIKIVIFRSPDKEYTFYRLSFTDVFAAFYIT